GRSLRDAGRRAYGEERALPAVPGTTDFLWLGDGQARTDGRAYTVRAQHQCAWVMVEPAGGARGVDGGSLGAAVGVDQERAAAAGGRTSPAAGARGGGVQADAGEEECGEGGAGDWLGKEYTWIDSFPSASLRARRFAARPKGS